MSKLHIKVKVMIYAIKECISLSHIKFFLKNKKFNELYNVWHCLYGTYIDKLYWSYRNLLHPLDVLQIEFRHQVINRECYNNGTCIKCGCTVTALQGAKKSCDGKCYPYWINRKVFEKYYTKAIYKYPFNINNLELEIVLKEDVVTLWYNNNNKIV